MTEIIWRKAFIDIFSLLEIRQAGLNLLTQYKEDEDRKDKRKIRIERSIENWLYAFHTLACIMVEKFPERRVVTV
mgnify:CR=1 FL=1